MRVVFSGGGTGGHVYPALAVARCLLEDDGVTGLYIGTRGRAEERILARLAADGYHRLPFVAAPSAPFPGRRPLALLRFAALLGAGLLAASWHLLRVRPQLLFATGGYAAAPAVFAAALLTRCRLLNCRILVHEQNACPGLMNRCAARLADAVALTFPLPAGRLPGARLLHSGYPVRADLGELPTAAEARRALGLDPDRPLLFVFGGSQGARSLNRALQRLLPELLDGRLQVLHGVGSGGAGYDPVAEQLDARKALAAHPPQGLGGEAWRARLDRDWKAEAYFYDIRLAYAAADLVCCRAGAGAIFELLAAGRAALLVPKAGLPGDHQVANARRIEEAGAARLVLERPHLGPEGIEEGVDDTELLAALRGLLDDAPLRATLAATARRLARPQATAGLAEWCRRLAAGDDPESLILDQTRSAGDVEDVTTPPGGSRAAPQDGLEVLDLEGLVRHAQSGSLSEANRRYLEYRCGAALAAEAWSQRNAGIKLAAALRWRGAIKLLLAIAADRRPPAWLPRLLGERRRQNGFIRRNLATALGRIGEATPAVEAALQELLADGYWEARVAAAEALGALRLGGPSIESALAPLKRGNFEEVRAVLRWWAACGSGEEGRRWLPGLLEHPNSLVRGEAVEALIAGVRDGRVPADEVRPLLDRVLVTSTSFRPVFPLKQGMKELARVAGEERRC
jgi:UDP-N-acetylglucosamine--N-acetylmuramyl-(pentapeptide) pyrophosphoryl-undecaprenol N-acetylglucosamine transferase